MNLDFEEWYMVLQDLARIHGENVSDTEVWRGEYEMCNSPEEAFFEEYPEHAN